MKKLIFTLSLMALSHLSLAFTEAELSKLNKGEMIKTVTWHNGIIWPEVSIVAIIDHTPEENMKVFSDFESHKKYVPDMLESHIIKQISENQKHVYFEMEMPWPVKRTSHVTNNVITKEADGTYVVKWNLVKADMLKDTYGFMRFEPYQGKTLMRYSNQIVPNSSFAGMFKDRVSTDVENSVTKIVSHLKKTIDKNQSSSLGNVSKKDSTSSLR